MTEQQNQSEESFTLLSQQTESMRILTGATSYYHDQKKVKIDLTH